MHILPIDDAPPMEPDMVTDLEALDYAEAATEAEIAAYQAAAKAVTEPAPNVEQQFRDLFLVSLPAHPRAVPVVGIIGVQPDGAQVLDRAWVFWPGQGVASVRYGRTFDGIAAVLRSERAADALARLDARIAALPPAATEPTPPPGVYRISEQDAARALAGVNASLGLPGPAPLVPLQARRALG